MKSIFFITTCMQCGGAERVLSILANHYVKIGWRVTIVMLLSNKIEYELDSEVRVICLNQKNYSKYCAIPLDILKLHRLIKNEKPDTVLSFTVKTNLVTLLASFHTRSKIIISERNDPRKDGRGSLVQRLTTHLYPKADAVVFQTRYAESCFNKKVLEKGRIIVNPILDLSPFIGSRCNVIYSAGRLCESKNFGLLIKAFALLHERLPDYKLKIYGEGPSREELQTQINNMGLQNVVSLEGHASDLHERVKDSKVFAFTSLREGMPNAVLEAMALGIPCVCTRYDGIDEILNESNGVVVESNDEEVYANALVDLLTNNEKWKTLSTESLKSSERFRLPNVIKQWETMLGE